MSTCSAAPGRKCACSCAATAALGKASLLVLHGDVEPRVLGPYRDDDERLEAARCHRAENGDQDGLYRLDGIDVSAFTGAELEAAE